MLSKRLKKDGSQSQSSCHSHKWFPRWRLMLGSSFCLGNCIHYSGLPQWLSGKESACSAGATGDIGSIPRSGRSPGGEQGNPLQYSCLENPMDRGVWRATVRWVAKAGHDLATKKRQTVQEAMGPHEPMEVEGRSQGTLARLSTLP